MRISDWSSDVCSSDLTRAPICRSIWGWSRNIMAQRPRQFWRGSFVALAAVSLALPPALAAMTRSDHPPALSLPEMLLGQFTPAPGDPPLNARHSDKSEKGPRIVRFPTQGNQENPHKTANT